MEKKHYKNWKIQLVALILILLAVTSGTSAIASNIDSLLVEGRNGFYQAVDNQEQIDNTLTIFETIFREYPERKGLALTYIGAIVTLKGKHAFLPMKKLRFVREGLQQMENAVQQAPEDIEALFIYGMTCHHLPFFFGRKDHAMESFSRIIDLLDRQYQKYDSEIVLDVIQFMENEIGLDEQEELILEEIKVELDRS